MKVDLKNYICSVPFTSLEIHNNVCFVCCPSWLPNKIEINEIPLKDVYNSKPIVDIRNSILSLFSNTPFKQTIASASTISYIGIDTLNPSERGFKNKGI